MHQKTLGAVLAALCAAQAVHAVSVLSPSDTRARYVHLHPRSIPNTTPAPQVPEYDPQSQTSNAVDGNEGVSERTSQLNLKSHGLAGCGAGCAVSASGSCYDSLAAAISASPSGGTVEIASDITVTSQITFSKDISLVGCGSPSVNAAFSGQPTDAAILRATGAGQSITLRNINFRRTGSGLASALRTPELGSGASAQSPSTSVDVTIEDCSFSNFRVEARGGAAVFLGSVTGLRVSGSEFTGNHVQKWGTHYDGGGALWLFSINGNAEIKGNKFKDNVHEFEHSTGGAIGVYEVNKGHSLEIDGNFYGNKAAGGGAVYIGTVRQGAHASISGDFSGNTAVDKGWGSRGGALWLQFVCGPTEVSGSFSNNQAPNDRGGAIANNRMTGKLTIEGDFENNLSKLDGSVFDSVHGFEPLWGVTEGDDGSLRLSVDLSGNRNKDGSGITIRMGSGKHDEALYGNGHKSGTYS
eukprot:comp17300_c0_seq1/m.16445 comp17300_c0_seq1/g.16445  ORF comp17300_c0_seq1/g.16445 comp17300_c0_seq1/m.16445 type:complete len:468 (-) comp17300_c0_seq1:426-1829(-)